MEELSFRPFWPFWCCSEFSSSGALGCEGLSTLLGNAIPPLNSKDDYFICYSEEGRLPGCLSILIEQSRGTCISNLVLTGTCINGSSRKWVFLLGDEWSPPVALLKASLLSPQNQGCNHPCVFRLLGHKSGISLEFINTDWKVHLFFAGKSTCLRSPGTARIGFKVS